MADRQVIEGRLTIHRIIQARNTISQSGRVRRIGSDGDFGDGSFGYGNFDGL
jgi:hypothetical protein